MLTILIPYSAKHIAKQILVILEQGVKAVKMKTVERQWGRSGVLIVKCENA